MLDRVGSNGATLSSPRLGRLEIQTNVHVGMEGEQTETNGGLLKKKMLQCGGLS